MRSIPKHFARSGAATQSAPVSETSPTSGYPWTDLPSRMILFADGTNPPAGAAHSGTHRFWQAARSDAAQESIAKRKFTKSSYLTPIPANRTNGGILSP
jgi:hypothetical protein